MILVLNMTKKNHITWYWCQNKYKRQHGGKKGKIIRARPSPSLFGQCPKENGFSYRRCFLIRNCIKWAEGWWWRRSGSLSISNFQLKSKKSRKTCQCCVWTLIHLLLKDICCVFLRLFVFVCDIVITRLWLMYNGAWSWYHLYILNRSMTFFMRTGGVPDSP